MRGATRALRYEERTISNLRETVKDAMRTLAGTPVSRKRARVDSALPSTHEPAAPQPPHAARDASRGTGDSFTPALPAPRRPPVCAEPAAAAVAEAEAEDVGLGAEEAAAQPPPVGGDHRPESGAADAPGGSQMAASALEAFGIFGDDDGEAESDGDGDEDGEEDGDGDAADETMWAGADEGEEESDGEEGDALDDIDDSGGDGDELDDYDDDEEEDEDDDDDAGGLAFRAEDD